MSDFSKNRFIFHPKSNQIGFHDTRLANLMGLYRASADPADSMRINAGGPTRGLFDGLPTNRAYTDAKCYNWINDYDINTTNVWHQGAVGSGTPLAIGDGDSPFATFVTGALDNDFYQYTEKYERWKIVSGKDMFFMVGIKVSEATQIDFFVGLSARINGGTIGAGNNVFDTGAGNRYDCVGFRKDDGDTQIDAECRKNGTATSETNVLTCAANTMIYLGFHVDGGTKVEFFAGTTINTKDYVTQITANLPDDEELAVIFGCRNGDGNARTMTIYPIWVMKEKD